MIELKNRFIFAPIKLGYSDGEGHVTERHINFYSARSRYLGAVIIEPLYMDRGLREIPTQLGIDSDEKIDGLKKLVDSIHKFDTKVIAHLNHPGRMANPKIDGNYFVSSTDKACENGGATPRRMDREDMEKAKKLFVDSAIRAEKAGFDGIELQFGHGYLMAQFISPSVNDRDDEYGGSFENRIGFPLNVLKEVKKSVDLPIIARISGDEMITDGIKLEEMKKFSKILEENGVEALHVTAGTVCSTPPWFFQHMFIPKGKTWELAEEIKKQVSIPIIFVGRINTFEDIEKLRRKADYIAIGRGLVADPDFVGKYLKKVEGIPRPCMACSDGCLGGVKSGQGLRCVVNPLVGNDSFKLEKAGKPKRYAVVGGGLAGMEAALTLRKRGHTVTLYEAEALGGQFNLACLPPNKENLSKIVEFYKSELESYGIGVIYKEADESIADMGYDGVLLATGSRPAIPRIEGLEKYYWAEVLRDENLFDGKKALIIGGGLIGIEVANKLLKRGNEVIIVEMFGEVARGMEAIEKTLTMKSLEKGGILIYLNSRVARVDKKKVFVEGEHNMVIDNVDHIILAAGMKSYNPLEEKLNGNIPVWVIGDAKKVGKAQDAIKDAFETAKNL